jgi:hypothetical protein
MKHLQPTQRAQTSKYAQPTAWRIGAMFVLVTLLAVPLVYAAPNAPSAGNVSNVGNAAAGVQLAALEADALQSDPVEAGHEALSEGRRPWYDAQTDSTQRVKIREPWGFSEFDAMDGTWAQLFAWATLALLIVVLLGGVIYAIVHWQRPIDNAEPDMALIPELSAARSELLPVRAGSTADQLRGEAQQHFAAGRHGEAVVCLYSLGLLRLDQLQMIHLARGKTNRQYLRELSRNETLHTPMRQMVEVFEGYFFGGHDVSRQRCEQCLAHVDTIHAAGQEVTP